MAFVDSKYETDDSVIMLIRMTTEENAVAGTEPAGDVDLNAHAYASGSRQRFGVHARGLSLKRTVGTAPDTFNKYTFLALRSAADLAAPGNQVGQTVAIGLINWTVSSQIPERRV